MRYLILITVLLLTIATAKAQETTEEPPIPTPVPTLEPTAEPMPAHIVEIEGQNGQIVQLEYRVTTGDLIQIVILVTLLISLWSIFAIVMITRQRRSSDDV
jgi:hypothetical protein